MKSFKLSLSGISLIFAILISSVSCNSINKADNKSNETSWIGSDTLALVARIDSLKQMGFQMADLHAHLKGGLTLDELAEYSEKSGITYGVAANCGIGFPITTDKDLMEYYYSLVGYPFYKGLQAEGREWINLFTIDSVKQFEYAFTDAMTFTDDQGRRTRLWMKDEVWVEDKQAFMDMLVDRIVGIMENEPVQIYVNSTFIPEIIQSEYDELWTDARMDRVIKASVDNGIAIEISSRLQIPSAKFIKKAKAAGVKFTMGTNNTGKDLGFLDYAMDMIDECDLEPSDFWTVQ
jgi:hypothetical protein